MSLLRPVALAHDAVSARFVVANADNDVLQVVSESSGNAMNLVSPGWAGGARITALAIDRGSGTLWVAGTSDTTATLYRVQLISGRLLNASKADPKLQATAFTALALGPGALYALDAPGRRIFSLSPTAQSLRVFARLPKDIVPIGLASTGAALYVAHASGLLRIDLASPSPRPVTSSKADVSNLQSIAWRNGTLFGIQRRDSTARAVRVRFDARGTTVTALDVIEPAATDAATLSGDSYYFLGERPGESGLAVRSISTVK
jgi:hypothetical protein